MGLKIYRHVLWVALVLFLSSSLAYSAQTVVVAFSEFPPYKMIVDGKHTGIDLDILQEIGKQMNFTLEFKNGTFEDCLGMMKQGEADLMTSLLRRAEREPYIFYVQPRYRTRSDKVFYLLKDHQKSIRTYDDLKTLKIGVKDGASYALSFDNDKTLNKLPAQSIKINIAKLVAGQIDTFITTDTEGDYWIKTLGLQDRITKAPFKFQQLDSIYMGISKKSAFATEAKRFGRILKDLVDKGVVQRTVEKYLK
jgi:polar amino acid transport system substrate-binding protein